VTKSTIVVSDFGPMLVNPNDQYIVPSIVQSGVYADRDIKLVLSLIKFLVDKNGSATFYDVGANFGIHTLAVASLLGGKVKVRAFEAQKQIFFNLCGSVALNGLANVDCHHVAVTDGSTKTLQFDTPDYDSINNFGGLELVPAESSDNALIKKVGKETVNCVALDDYSERVDFIKMDIEGMEHQALLGATKTFDQYRPICFLEVLKSDPVKIKAFFEARDYSITPFSHMDWVLIPGEMLDADIEI